MHSHFQFIDTEQLNKKIAAENFPFSSYLFWDAETDKINLKENTRYVIERVLTRGFLEDFYMLIHLYNTEEIKDALRKSKVLDAKTVSFCSHYFNLPQSEMYVSPFYS